jgi:hypothetical protein
MNSHLPIQALCKFALSSRCWLGSLRLDWVYCLRIIRKLSALSLEVVIMEAQYQAADNLAQFRLLVTNLRSRTESTVVLNGTIVSIY